ncbi:hypothetical protein D3C81_1771810 [compost metagenome]
MVGSAGSNGVLVGALLVEFRLNFCTSSVVDLGAWFAVCTCRSLITPFCTLPLPSMP